MTLGTFSARDLLHSVNHAEAFCELLGRLRPPLHDLVAIAWLSGRRQEIECFVGLVGAELRSRRIDQAGAKRALDTYLQNLHKGLFSHFGQRFPTCCALSAACGSVGQESGQADDTRTYPLERRSPIPARQRQDGSKPPGIDELLAGIPSGELSLTPVGW